MSTASTKGCTVQVNGNVNGIIIHGSGAGPPLVNLVNTAATFLINLPAVPSWRRVSILVRSLHALKQVSVVM